MPKPTIQQRSAVALSYALSAVATLFPTIFNYRHGVPVAEDTFFVYGGSTFVLIIASLTAAYSLGYLASPLLFKNRALRASLIGGAVGFGAYSLGDLAALTLSFTLSQPNDCCDLGQYVYYAHGPLPDRWLTVGTGALLLGVIIGLVIPQLAQSVSHPEERRSNDRREIREEKCSDAGASGERDALFAFGLAVTTGVAQIITFPTDFHFLLGVPICMTTAWLLSRRLRT